MDRVKLIVKTESANLWWGVYGFCEKTGWEDLNIFNDRKVKIAGFCLNAKGYLRGGVEDLRNDPSESKFVDAVDKYLNDDKIHYWYYYNDLSDNFYEVPYKAPLNERGEKPRYLDIWHPDEGIDTSTIHSAVANFAKAFLEMENVDIEILESGTFEESLKSYKEHLKHFEHDGQITVEFSDNLVKDLSVLWKKSREEVLEKLNRSVK